MAQASYREEILDNFRSFSHELSAGTARQIPIYLIAALHRRVGYLKLLLALLMRDHITALSSDGAVFALCFVFYCHCEPQSGVAIRIPCGAKHRPSPEGTERERIATALRASQ